jgi:hypothetical protein
MRIIAHLVSIAIASGVRLESTGDKPEPVTQTEHSDPVHDRYDADHDEGM